jgi:hypothetical protein
MTVSPSHQTIKLSAGRHRGAEHGACVMELASMLADRTFSDHPQSACPVIAAFLRSYNDHVDDRRRQDLYRYAARAPAPGPTPKLSDGGQRCAWRGRARAVTGPDGGVRILHRMLWYCQGPDVHAIYAARAAAVTPGGHERALAFLDELIELPPTQARVVDAPIALTTRASRH